MGTKWDIIVHNIFGGVWVLWKYTPSISIKIKHKMYAGALICGYLVRIVIPFITATAHHYYLKCCNKILSKYKNSTTLGIHSWDFFWG
jgi:hypothetical protein